MALRVCMAAIDTTPAAGCKAVMSGMRDRAGAPAGRCRDRSAAATTRRQAEATAAAGRSRRVPKARRARRPVGHAPGSTARHRSAAMSRRSPPAACACLHRTRRDERPLRDRATAIDARRVPRPVQSLRV
jgi:hypothetical protein